MDPHRRFLLAASLLAATTTSRARGQEESGPQRALRLQPLPPADAASTDDGVGNPVANDLKLAYPRYAYVESPWGFSRAATFAGVTAGGVNTSAETQGQAGVRVGGAFDRVTVHALLGRGLDQRWAPTATVQVRVLGSPGGGYALGVFGQYKTEGFTEAGGEAEVGATLGLRHRRLYLEINAVAGAGLEEEEANSTRRESSASVSMLQAACASVPKGSFVSASAATASSPEARQTTGPLGRSSCLRAGRSLSQRRLAQPPNSVKRVRSVCSQWARQRGSRLSRLPELQQSHEARPDGH